MCDFLLVCHCNYSSILYHLRVIYYRQDLPQAAAGIVFTHGPILGFFAPQGRHVAPIKVKFGRHERAPPCQISPWSAQGWEFTAPKTEKNWNFTNIIAPKGRVPCTSFSKFISFMRVLSLHNFAKYGCFISINDKIINNLLWLGHFQPNFRRPLTAKLWTGAKKVLDLKWWHGPPLSPCKIWWKSRNARRRERIKCDVFHFFIFIFVYNAPQPSTALVRSWLTFRGHSVDICRPI